MTLLSKIGLSGKFGRIIYIISAILTVAMAVTVAFRPLAIPFCLLIKLFSIPIIAYLHASFSKSQEVYFYINLGISRKEYYLIPFAVDFIAFVLLIIVSGTIGYAAS